MKLIKADLDMISIEDISTSLNITWRFFRLKRKIFIL